jgi:short-subunit dehydrogenase
VATEAGSRYFSGMTVSERTLVVTGGGSGIGRELVLQLLGRGARVAAVDRNEAGLAETVRLAAAPGDRLVTFAADIADRGAVDALPDAVAARLRPADGLVNNAGIIQPFVRARDLPWEVIERVMRVNFYGALHMTRAFLPGLLTRPVAHLVNVSSMGAFVPVPGQAIYGASKAALKLFTEALRLELAATSVKVTLVLPGAVDTGIVANSGVEMRSADGGDGRAPMLSAAEAARVILDAIEADRFRVLVGRDARAMDRLVRLNPDRAARLVWKRMRGLLAD